MTAAFAYRATKDGTVAVICRATREGIETEPSA